MRAKKRARAYVGLNERLDDETPGNEKAVPRVGDGRIMIAPSATGSILTHWNVGNLSMLLCSSWCEMCCTLTLKRSSFE